MTDRPEGQTHRPANESPQSAHAPHSIILASGSPRRRELLARLGLPFNVVPSGAEEIVPVGLAPATVAEELACQKALAVARHYPECTVVGADTVVALAGPPSRIFGKPRDDVEAAAMLRALRGRWHQVSTGIVVVCAGDMWRDTVTADVRMHAYSDDEIARYVASGEPRDKAGAYAIQGLGGALVAEVRGSELTVVGLPLRRLAELLVASGVDLPVEPATIVDAWHQGGYVVRTSGRNRPLNRLERQ
jgi:septum formation protein